MSQEQGKSTGNGATAGKGKAFFDQADQVAETANWDYAIEMCVEGLKREPGNLERGHRKLREIAMKRKIQGGKAPGMIEQLKRRSGKDPAENLANASYFLAKDPGSVFFMEQVMQAAGAMGLAEVVRWVGEILIESQRQAKKPNKRICLVCTDTMEKFEHYDLAVQACSLAQQAAPNDANIETRMGHLGAKYTMAKGGYGDKESDFTSAVKDMSVQAELLEKDSLVKGKSFLEQQLAKAKEEYQADPTVAGKINALVDALVKFEDPAYENEAIDVLTKAFEDSKSYRFKMRIGDIRIRQLSRQYRKLRDAGEKDGAKKLAKQQLEFEIEEYAERAKNYPTDLGIKYELGRRLLLAGRYDDAIGSLQQAQRDPRRHVSVMNYLGQAFMKKQWWQEAIDTYEKVTQGDLSEDRLKEIRYNLGCCYEQLGDLTKAQEQFSHVAQVDFNFKDVRQRVEAIRTKISQQKQ